MTAVALGLLSRLNGEQIGQICAPDQMTVERLLVAQAVTCVHRDTGTANTVRGDIWGSRELRLWPPR